MKLFMSKNAEESLKDFDEGLEKYFATSRRYRSRLRRGTIVLVDNDSRIFDLLMFLVERCGLKVGVVHVDNASCAKKAIEDVGTHEVKAVVIDSDMLGESLNGDSLTSWLARECSRVPVWVVNCDKERREWIRSQTKKIGILNESESLAGVVEAIGLPNECQKFVAEYAH